ncbi:Bug family tripartite tricarboxylate transporter substrate binding protein [Ramlibacter sp.]|uniref:Bug family tripartite tricarboxylate transporter substrate binding protein n=1 Tax=Ramlibacter sp. TaxID=1917967 RepID=UPI003D126E43
MHPTLGRLVRASCAGIVAFASLVAAGSAAAQAGAAGFPTKPLRLIVPFASGGPADAIGRIAAQGLSNALGQPVIVDNRAGAGGRVGAEAVAKAAPDGYTLLLCNVGDAMAVSLYKSMPYDFGKDFAPVSLLASSPFLIAVHPSLPAQDFKQFLALAKAQPGKLTYGSAGTGVSSHLSGEALKVAAGIDIVHVPYKGQAPAMNDLLGGQIAFMFANPVTTLQQVRAGKLRALAVTGTSRFAGAPDIPTVAESGVPGYEAATWFGIAAPAGTPEAIVNRLSAELQKVMNSTEVRTALESQGAAVVASNAPDFARRIRADIDAWRTIIRTARISLD